MSKTKEQNQNDLCAADMELAASIIEGSTNRILALEQQNRHMAARLKIYDEMVEIFKAHTPNNNGLNSPDDLKLNAAEFLQKHRRKTN